MCDTLVALPEVTADKSLLFLKNSDREPNEAQAIEQHPHIQHASDRLRCTYIEIPQVDESWEVILSRPFQMWGAEMGVNQHGVVIGNEAIFSRMKLEKKNIGLTGMDMVRLALERCRTADQAVECIIGLLITYGQNACGGYRNKKFFYHNSFLIADYSSAWVLETAGTHWALEKVKGIRSISNHLSVGRFAERVSDGAEKVAVEKGWWKSDKPFRFDEAYSDWLYTTMARGKVRSACTASMAKKKERSLALADCFEILATHNLPEASFKPSRATTGSVCMHATGLLNPSSTTGSMVAVIRQQLPHTVWLTGTPHPCLSIYVPFYFGSDALKEVKVPGPSPDDSLWWRAERIHRWIGNDYKRRRKQIENERNTIQQKFISEEATLINASASANERDAFSKSCIETAMTTLEQWAELIDR